MIYLDYNATTPVAPEVARVINLLIEEEFGNPSSGHILGKRARERLEEARKEVADFIGARPWEIVFTSGGSESNNMAIKGIAYAMKGRGNHIITSAIEHLSVLNPCMYLMREGFEITILPVDSFGRIDPGDVFKAIKNGTILISIMHANNEVGTIEPVEDIGKIARDRGIPFHVDASQSVGKIRVNVEEISCDLLTISGHKLYAPKGVGALYIREGLNLEPLIHGAGQERQLRAGTENVLLNVGFGTACRISKERMKRDAERIKLMRDRLYERILSRIDGAVLNGHPEYRLPNTLNISLPKVLADDILKRVPSLCISTGAACHDRSDAISHVLSAMGRSKEAAKGTLRLSLGRGTTEKDIDEAVEIICDAWEELVRKGARGS
jgi:cysteine desulfurase